MPDSVEQPAPVSATTRRSRNSWISALISTSRVSTPPAVDEASHADDLVKPRLVAEPGEVVVVQEVLAVGLGVGCEHGLHRVVEKLVGGGSRARPGEPVVGG